MQFGGGHEGNLRSGTLNVPGIVGMGEALRIAGQRMKADAVHLSDLRARLLNALKSIPDIRWNAGDVPLLPHVASITFGFRGGDRMLAMIARDVAASSGSACSTPAATGWPATCRPGRASRRRASWYSTR